MGELFFAIAVVVAIARGLYRFFRWAARSLNGLSTPTGTSAPPEPMPLPPRNTSPPPITSRDTTPAITRNQDARPPTAEPPRRDATPTEDPAQPASSPVPLLFGNSSDLVRALILQEALGPPLSKRRNTAE